MSGDDAARALLSSLSGHRRTASHGPAPDALPLPAQTSGSSPWINNGLTPAFELYDDPLSAPLPPDPPSPSCSAHRHRAAHHHQPSTAVHLPDVDEEAKGAPQRSGSGSERETGRAGRAGRAAPCHVRTEARQDTEPSSAGNKAERYSRGSKAHQHLGGWLKDGQSERNRSISPHLSSTRGHTTHSRVGSPSIDIHRRAWTPTHAISPPPQPPHHFHRTLPNRQGSLHRKASEATQAPLKSPGARSSPVSFKTAARADLQDTNTSEALRDDQDDQDDDDEEADKGHGRRGTPHFRRRSTGGAGPSSAEVRSASRAGVVHDARGGDGRKTPAQHRPEKQSHKSHSTPLHDPHSVAPDGGRSSTSSHYPLAMHGHQPDSTSPLVCPQARRGAINLKTKRLARKKCKKIASDRQSRHFCESVFTTLKTIKWHIAHPVLAAQQGKTHLLQVLRDTDKAFRCPVTGQRVWWPEWLGAYIPLLIWLVISLSSTVTVLTFHKQVFKGLDTLSKGLQSMGMAGKVIIGGLIFLTTFPPLPLYSTLIVLCGFSFGLWQGFVISYSAALSGAIAVYLLSKSLLRRWMDGLLSKSGGLKKVVRAIEKRPKLLFLIRLAPYPYNLMNTLLASSPTLTFKTYFLCTALALPKLLVHCGLGASIKNFAAYNGATDDADGGGETEKKTGIAETAKKVAGFAGVALCIGIFLYLFSVARKAVDEEVDSDAEGGEYDALDAEETSSVGEEEISDDEAMFLSNAQSGYHDRDDGDDVGGDDDDEGYALDRRRSGSLGLGSTFKLQAPPHGVPRSTAVTEVYEVPEDAVAFRIASPEALEMSHVYASSTSPALNLSGRNGRGGGDQPYSYRQNSRTRSPFDLLATRGSVAKEAGPALKIDFMEEEAARR